MKCATVSRIIARRGDGWRTIEEPLVLVDTSGARIAEPRPGRLPDARLSTAHASRDVQAETRQLAVS